MARVKSWYLLFSLRFSREDEVSRIFLPPVPNHRAGHSETEGRGGACASQTGVSHASPHTHTHPPAGSTLLRKSRLLLCPTKCPHPFRAPGLVSRATPSTIPARSGWEEGCWIGERHLGLEKWGRIHFFPSGAERLRSSSSLNKTPPHPI